ncbi:MAG: hypothetical protein K0S76_238 [Herbinix sp.]|jgi:hypothetical protein|nr:hypothetical protein [Herbinix sp.]
MKYLTDVSLILTLKLYFIFSPSLMAFTQYYYIYKSDYDDSLPKHIYINHIG